MTTDYFLLKTAINNTEKSHLLYFVNKKIDEKDLVLKGH